MGNLADQRGIDLDVYEPAEDSALLARTVADHLDAPDLVLDVGTGTGYVGALIARETGARVVGTDINPHACRRARENGLEAVRADLVAPVRAATVDAAVFNPPYLPETGVGEWDDWLEAAITGGETGREVIATFLADVGRVLAPGGSAFLLVSTATGVEAVVETAAEHGFSAVALAEDAYPAETLVVLKLVGCSSVISE